MVLGLGATQDFSIAIDEIRIGGAVFFKVLDGAQAHAQLSCHLALRKFLRTLPDQRLCFHTKIKLKICSYRIIKVFHAQSFACVLASS